MKTSSKLATLALTTGLALAGLAGPAQAETTTATFAITGGVLAVTVPAAATLGAVSAGASTASGQLGIVTVVDLRGALDNSWTNTVSSTPFALTLGTGSPNETVAADKIAYSTGEGTVTANGTFTAGSLANLSVPGAAGVHSASSGVSTTTWTPNLTLTLLSSQVVGTYTGTVTHSIA